jgi:glutathione peroxidase
MKKEILMAALFASFLALFGAAPGVPDASAAEKTVYDFTLKTIDGKEKPLADYRGKALLIVNTASRCGFTPQYEGLEALYEKYHARGFEVLAFPSNDFLGQEPGSDAEIKQFCLTNYSVGFPLFSKIGVKGKGMHPLYKYLTKDSSSPGDITWNFNKFVVSPDGRVTARYGSKTDPLSDEIVQAVEAVLPA